MLPVPGLPDRLSGWVDIRRDVLLDHGRNAPEPGHPLWSVAADLRCRCIGNLCHETAEKKPIALILPLRRGCRYFGLRLWDYRGLFLNLDGIICLRSILSFALLGFHDLLEPTVDRMVRRIRPSVLQAASLSLMFAADCLFSALFRTPITYYAKYRQILKAQIP